jgi:hypothetical protein
MPHGSVRPRREAPAMLSVNRQLLYAESDIPEGITLREWRYRRARPARSRRLHLVRRVAMTPDQQGIPGEARAARRA